MVQMESTVISVLYELDSDVWEPFSEHVTVRGSAIYKAPRQPHTPDSDDLHDGPLGPLTCDSINAKAHKSHDLNDWYYKAVTITELFPLQKFTLWWFQLQVTEQMAQHEHGTETLDPVSHSVSHSVSDTILHGVRKSSSTASSAARLHRRRWYSLCYPSDLLKQQRNSQCLPSPIMTVSLIREPARKRESISGPYVWMAPVMGKMWRGRIGMFSGNCQRSKNKGNQIEFYLSSHLHTHSLTRRRRRHVQQLHSPWKVYFCGDGAIGWRWRDRNWQQCDWTGRASRTVQQNKDMPHHVIFWLKQKAENERTREEEPGRT